MPRILGAVVAAASLSLAGEATAAITYTLDFNALAHAGYRVDQSNPFIFEGFEISNGAPRTTIDVWGQTAPENADPGGATVSAKSLSIRRIDGKVFDLVSFDAAEQNNSGTGSTFTYSAVNFRNWSVNSPIVVNFDQNTGLQTVGVPSNWGARNLGYVYIYSRDGIQFDNLVFTRLVDAPASVPEPATWAMLIAGFGLSGIALRFRRRADFA